MDACYKADQEFLTCGPQTDFRESPNPLKLHLICICKICLYGHSSVECVWDTSLCLGFF